VQRPAKGFTLKGRVEQSPAAGLGQLRSWLVAALPVLILLTIVECSIAQISPDFAIK
jgi:hypothetical protein